MPLNDRFPSQRWVRKQTGQLFAGAEEQHVPVVRTRKIIHERPIVLHPQELENVSHGGTCLVPVTVGHFLVEGDLRSSLHYIARSPESVAKISKASLQKIIAFEVDSFRGAMPPPVSGAAARCKSRRARMGGLYHHDQRHLLSRSLQLLRSFECHQPAETETAQEVGSLGLQRSDFLQIGGGDLLQGFVLRDVAIQTARLQRIYGLIFIEMISQRIIFKNISPVAVNQE